MWIFYCLSLYILTWCGPVQSPMPFSSGKYPSVYLLFVCLFALLSQFSPSKFCLCFYLGILLYGHWTSCFQHLILSFFRLFSISSFLLHILAESLNFVISSVFCISNFQYQNFNLKSSFQLSQCSFNSILLFHGYSQYVFSYSLKDVKGIPFMKFSPAAGSISSKLHCAYFGHGLSYNY